MNNPFLIDLCRKIDLLYPEASSHLDRIDALPDLVSKKIVNTILIVACQAQLVGNITAARSLMQTMPPIWLASVLRDTIEEVVDLNDEWEYRRLIELLKELKSELLVSYLDYGITSDCEAIHEAATDLKHF